MRRHAELAGLKSDFTILDTDDVIRLLATDPGGEPRRQALAATPVRHDDRRLEEQGFWPHDIPEGDARSFGNGKGRELFAAYQERLKTLNACDFGDLLCHPIRIFRENPDVLKDYHRRFKYILVDEYQDTNTAQYLWLRLLAQRPTSPRGEAAPQRGAGGVARGSPHPVLATTPGEGNTHHRQHLLRRRRRPVDLWLARGRGRQHPALRQDFPGATIIRLERNYRSTAQYSGRPHLAIAHNEGRFGKTLFTDRNDPEDGKVIVHAAWDSDEEARAVGEEIEQAQRRGHSLNDMAILVRASFQTRSFEDRFIEIGLNYRVIGGPRFYERQEIRDAMAYFRVVAQGADDLAFERIVNVPKRGLGEATIRQIHDTARALGIPMLAAAAQLAESDELKPKPRAALREVAANFARWQAALETTPHTELAETILEESGYTDMWKNDRSAEAPDGWRTSGAHPLDGGVRVDALVPGACRARHGRRAECRADAVIITDAALGQGLEFDTVFLPGWEGLSPPTRARRGRTLGAGGGAPPSASASPGPRNICTSGSSPTAASTASGSRPYRRVSSRTAGGACRGVRHRNPYGATAIP